MGIQEKLLIYPNALIVTIGDTQVDFPMHEHAHLAYHVGQENVWKTHYLPQCMLVRDDFGRDSQHVTGTLHVLNILKNGLGKSISNWILPQASEEFFKISHPMSGEKIRST